ncbi:MAG: hypothetical protein IJW66_04330 [Clostridia bacterium]|nr:hypothetical protein [Clostridia bacterium]
MDFSKYGYKPKSSCESCEFYEYDEYTDSYSCTMNLDEDEMVGFLSGTRGECHYYRYYDEYKSVHKQI